MFLSMSHPSFMIQMNLVAICFGVMQSRWSSQVFGYRGGGATAEQGHM